MKNFDEYYRAARDIFIASQPDAQAEIDKLDPQQATAVGLSLTEYQQFLAERYYAAFLNKKQLDGIIFSIQLVETDKHQAAIAIEAYLRQQAEVQGLSFDAFCSKNKL